MSEVATYQRRKIRELLTSLMRLAEDRGCRRLMVTSVGAGEGKTVLCRALRSASDALDETRCQFVSQQYLDRISPDDADPDSLIIIDGPSALEDDGLSRLPVVWRRAIDGVVLVVVKRETNRTAIEEARTWLAANGIPIVAVVWNEHLLPPLAIQIERLKAWFRTVGRRGRRAHAAMRPSEEEL